VSPAALFVTSLHPPALSYRQTEEQKAGIGGYCVVKGSYVGRGWSMGFWQYCVTTHSTSENILGGCLFFFSTELFDIVDFLIGTE